jgi:serine/threonine protein kinase
MSPAAMFLSSFSAPPTPTFRPDTQGAVVGGYTLGPIIGYGGFSIIRRASSASAGTVAVKIVRHDDLESQRNPTLARKCLDRESAVWSSLCHEHILPLFSVVNTAYADFFFTLFCPAGSLFDILKREGTPALPQEEVGMMFRQVVRGLRYLHEVAGMVHRDIKPENVLVDEMGICKICDFGMTVRIGESGRDDDDDEASSSSSSSSSDHQQQQAGRVGLNVPSTRHHHRKSAPPSSIRPSAPPPHAVQPGSLPYASPELLLPQKGSVPHPAQDIWALGVLLYVLLTGKLPFSDAFEPRLQMKILLGQSCFFY